MPFLPGRKGKRESRAYNAESKLKANGYVSEFNPRKAVKTKRAMNLRDEFASKLDELYRWAEQYGMSCPELIEAKGKLRAMHPLDKCPGWVHAYVEGYDRALWNSLWRNKLEWRLFLDGALRTSAEVDAISKAEPKDFEPRAYSRIDSEKSTHVWKHMPDKPF